MKPPEGNVVRYATATRINHWITAICFVLLTLSGLSMFHPIFFFFSALFGGGQWTRAVHPWIGIVLVLSYAGLVMQFWRENFWNQDDTAWVRKFNLVLVNEEEGVPEVGQFNAGQKFVFWAMALFIPVLLFTGIVIWEVYFSAFTPLVANSRHCDIIVAPPFTAISTAAEAAKGTNIAISGQGRSRALRGLRETRRGRVDRVVDRKSAGRRHRA